MIPKECTPDDPDWELWDRGSRVTDLLFKSGDSNDNLVQRIDHVAAGWVGLITEGTWRKFVPCTDEWDGARHVLRSIRGSEGVIEYRDFDRFLQQPPPQGLGDDERRSKFRAMVARFPADAQERINLALVAAEIKPISEVRSEAGKQGGRGNEKHFDPDQNALSKPKYNTGTSTAYQMQLLARSGRKDLIEMVTGGQTTLKNALEQAGLKKDRPRLELTPGTSPTKLALWLREHYGRDALKSLCQDVCEVLGDCCDDQSDDDEEYAPAPQAQPIADKKVKLTPLVGVPYDGSPEWNGHAVNAELMERATRLGAELRPWPQVKNSVAWRRLAPTHGSGKDNPAFDPYRQAYNEAVKGANR